MERLVSIITPCYNSSKYIEETYSSIKNQVYKNWEWNIVDDCSTDDSVEIIKSFNDDRINLIINPENLGASISRNKGLDLAKGDYITYIDSDDLWKNNFLVETINYLEKNNEKFVYTSYERVDENLNKLLDDFIAIDKISYKRLLYNCPIPMLTSIYNAKEVGKIYFPEVELREDHAMWLELLKIVEYARAIDKSLGIYRIRENSVSRNKFKIAIKQYELYRNYLNMNLVFSLYYTINWAINGLRKYGKL